VRLFCYVIAIRLQSLAECWQARVTAPLVEGSLSRKSDSSAGGGLYRVAELGAPAGEKPGLHAGRAHFPDRTQGQNESKTQANQKQEEAPAAGLRVVSTIASTTRTPARRTLQRRAGGAPKSSLDNGLWSHKPGHRLKAEAARPVARPGSSIWRVCRGNCKGSRSDATIPYFPGIFETPHSPPASPDSGIARGI